MSRGRGNQVTEIEQQRVRADEIANTRGAGKRGSGPKNFEHKGYGSEPGMQTNRESMPADKKGI